MWRLTEMTNDQDFSELLALAKYFQTNPRNALIFVRMQP